MIGHFERLPAGARTRPLRETGYRVLRAADPGPPIGLEAYCRRPHVLVSAAGDLTGIIDDALSALGRRRHVVLAVPLFGVLRDMLSPGELVATVPTHLARALAGAALRDDPLPFSGPSYGIAMAWAAVADRDPAERAFRALLREVAAQVLSPPDR